MATIPLQRLDRQAVVVRLDSRDVRIVVWYQPGTSGWYASVEVPTGTPRVTGRRLVTDAALLRAGTLAGNLYVRATAPLETGDPGDGEPWGVSHRLVYEP